MTMYQPNSEQDLADLLRDADAPLAVQGGATRGVNIAGAPLSTCALKGVRLYEPGALTLVAGAGTPLPEIEALLAAENQRLAFEPSDLRGLLGSDGIPTLGGAIATNTSGPRRIQSGAARDFLLGVRFVDGMGQIIKNGGRVMKNVTGYDLVKLMAGSHGTLGVLSEVSLKVLPSPECSGTLIWENLDWQASLAIFSAALNSPYDVTGAARLPAFGERPAKTLIRVEGFEASVSYRLSQLSGHLKTIAQSAEMTMDVVRNAQLWRSVRDVEPFVGKEGDLWRSSIKPRDMPAFVAALDGEHMIDWAGGLIWSLVPKGRDARAALNGFGGHCTLLRGAHHLSRFQPEPAPLAALSAGLRKKFDPRGILNVGLMG
ncbi:FAD-binding protein [Epibacterium ulvae]|uniref:FAD-binding protein n=1 Tax=Epibacterium ulvae TaxID=1156985 RepID=UPI0024914B97|nr:FAD-binding protein [Epibacterium ulvae]